MPSIASLKKAELVAAIQGLGEDPPAEWRVMELRNRLAELEQEKGVTRQTGKTKTNLQEWVVRLNYAAKKKVTLQQFMQNDLHMSLTGNETMAQLTKKAMDQIHIQSTPNGNDPIGFGEYAAKSYQEAKIYVPWYCDWAKTMAKEGDVSIRMARFVRWLEQQGNQPEVTEDQTAPKPKAMPKPRNPPSSSVARIHGKASPGVGSASTEDANKAILSQVMETMRVMQGEIEQLREERPHKRAETYSQDGSYVKVTDELMEEQD